MPRAYLLLVVLGLAGCAGSHAYAPAVAPKAGFAMADIDGDGSLDRDEWRQASAQLFLRLDGDRNGQLTPDEAIHPENVAALDRNRDGVTTPDEFMLARERLFAYADLSGNKRLSLIEVERAGPVIWEF
ncbi:MAG: hypothetical protein U1E14_17800 [Geminicoccaceae bacterium]